MTNMRYGVTPFDNCNDCFKMYTPWEAKCSRKYYGKYTEYAIQLNIYIFDIHAISTL